MKVPDDKCVICCDRPKSSFFIPCGHKSCTVCGVQLENSTHSCPFCRMEITGLGTIRD
ncbi:MAG: RING finger protein [Candidatus Thiodiazotropha sp.]